MKIQNKNKSPKLKFTDFKIKLVYFRKLLFILTFMILCQRQKCEVYTRVMGYHRPVSQFNEWKNQNITQEHISWNEKLVIQNS